jgi:hypothetical protein
MYLYVVGMVCNTALAERLKNNEMLITIS